MEHGSLIEMGNVVTLDIDGTKTEYNLALVIEFASVDEIRQAVEDGVCTFRWGIREPLSPEHTHKRG